MKFMYNQAIIIGHWKEKQGLDNDKAINELRAQTHSAYVPY